MFSCYEYIHDHLLYVMIPQQVSKLISYSKMSLVNSLILALLTLRWLLVQLFAVVNEIKCCMLLLHLMAHVHVHLTHPGHSVVGEADSWVQLSR